MTESSKLLLEKINIISDIDTILRKKKVQLIFKRIFDFVVSLISLIVLLPLFLIIAIVVKSDSKGPLFFKQIRVGKDEKEFKIFKFRTMVQDAEKKGMQITVGKDSRITKSGNFLRKSKIDEFPQLINVLLGDMSFVGPRPEVPKYVNLYTEEQKVVLKIRPGITDYASIEFKNENDVLALSNEPEKKYIEYIIPEKIKLNLKYIKKISFFEDLKLIFKTIFLIKFSNRNVKKNHDIGKPF